MGQQNSKSNLFLKVTLGETQSHELFDFQNGGVQHEQQLIQSPSYLIDKGETVQFLTEDQIDSINKNTLTPQNALYKIHIDDFQQITIKDLTHGTGNILWRVIKPSEACAIQPGDVLKIGKIKLQLKKIVQRRQQSFIQQETVKDYEANQSQQDDLESLKSGHSSCDRCRICFRSYNIKNDPLLCLCKCSGSIKYIHFLCLKDWIANNFSKREDQHCKFYTYQETNCQLCKQNLPNEFKHEGKSYSFLDFSTFEPPYAEFEYSEVENGRKKFYKYVISLCRDKEVVIGRNNSSQVIMKDISISRTHCSLEYKHGMLLLRDKKSKFGTLIKLDKMVEFSSEVGIQLQYDSKVIQMYNSNAFKSCCKDVDTYRLLYEGNNELPKSFSNRENYSDTRNLHPQQHDYEEANLQIIRLQNSSISQEHQREHSSGGRAIQVGLNLDENIERSMERPESGRMTMIRETIARDETVRY